MQGSRVLTCIGDRALLTLITARAMDTAEVVGATNAEATAVDLIQQHRPTLLVLSDQLEQGDGVHLVETVKQRWPALHTMLLVKQHSRRQAIARAITAECDGIVLLARLGSGTMVRALQVVSGGGIYIDEPLRQRYRRGHSGGPLQELSERELEVLQRLAEGGSNREVGLDLHLSAETVKSHVANLVRKLPARDRTHAVVQGLRWGLIDFPGLEPSWGESR
jgi:DNA-binding NarL/FixJ family response regulator